MVPKNVNVKKTYQNDHKKWPTIFSEKKISYIYPASES